MVVVFLHEAWQFAAWLLTQWDLWTFLALYAIGWRCGKWCSDYEAAVMAMPEWQRREEEKGGMPPACYTTFAMMFMLTWLCFAGLCYDIWRYWTG